MINILKFAILTITFLGLGFFVFPKKTEAAIRFYEDFEAASIDTNKWVYSINGSDWSIDTVNDPKKSGNRSVKFYIHRVDSESYRVELTPKSFGGFSLNNNQWFGFSLYLPEDWMDDLEGETVFQIHSNPDSSLGEEWRSPPLQLQFDEDLNKWSWFNIWDPKKVTIGNDPRPEGGWGSIWSGDLPKGQWVDWVLHYKPDYSSGGILEIWKDGQQVVNKKGPNAYNDSWFFVKAGIYKSKWKVMQTNVNTRVLYLDEIRIGDENSSYAEVMPGPRTYYLDPANGNDGNVGSEQFPWKTMDKAVTATSAGDTVNIRGGTYTKSQYNKPETSFFDWRTYGGFSLGKPGNPITIQAMPGEKVIFNGEGRVYFMRLNSIYNPNYPGHYAIIKDLNFINYRGVALGFGYRDGNTTYGIKNVLVDNCTFKNFTDADTGGVFMIGSENMILRNSTFENMGVSSGTMHPIYIAEKNKNILLENNTVNGASGFGIHSYGHNDNSKIFENYIIRNNTIINSHATQVLVSATQYDGVYIYNNTLFTTHHAYPPMDSGDADTHARFSPWGLKNIVFKNNISYGPVQVSNLRFSSWQANLDSSLRNYLPNFYFDYNIWFNTNNTNRLVSEYVNDGTNSRDYYYTLDEFRAMSGRSNNSRVIDPLFSDPDNFNLTLSDNSTAINTGDFLTRTTSAGSGINVAVQDAGYFIDGYDVTEGDTIKIGSETVTITGIDYQSNTLTIDRSISWQNNENVSLPYIDTKPDIGAYEYQGDNNPADVNEDGRVNIKDIQAVIREITGASWTCYNEPCSADVNRDGQVNIKDIQAIIRDIIS